MSTGIDKDWVSAYFEYGVDVNNRRVFLDDDIEDCSVSPLVKGLYLMESIDPKKPIELFISSFGGSVYEALALYDIINTLRCPVHTFGYGKIMSSAVLLLAAGTEGNRWITRHTSLLTHAWSAEIDGKSFDIRNTYQHYQKIEADWTDLLVKHTTKTKHFWDKLAAKNHDAYFTAEQAIEWGVVDAIWEEKSR